MTKINIIKKIKAIIIDYGAFTTADVEANSSPVIKSLGKDTHQLAERFDFHKVEAVIYVHESETGSDFILYEDLSKDTLTEILSLAKDWKNLNEE